jgi:hypothetical protein
MSGLAVLVALAASVALTLRPAPEATTQATLPSEKRAASVSQSLPPPPVEPKPQAAPMGVQVAIAAMPKRAQLKLDGKALGNPFVGVLPKGDQVHELEVRASGYRTERRSLVMSSDIAISLELTPESVRPREAPPVARSVQTPAPAPAPAPAPQSTPLASATAAVARPSVSSNAAQPGQELKKLVRTTRSIDGKDPYQ